MPGATLVPATNFRTTRVRTPPRVGLGFFCTRWAVKNEGDAQILRTTHRQDVSVRPGEACKARPRAVAAMWGAYARRKIIGEKEGAMGGMGMRLTVRLILSRLFWRAAAASRA